jgi:hypothetical protein
MEAKGLCPLAGARPPVCPGPLATLLLGREKHRQSLVGLSARSELFTRGRGRFQSHREAAMQAGIGSDDYASHFIIAHVAQI